MALIAPTALLFDWDNTLVNTWPVIHRALHDTFSKWGLTPWNMDETKLRVGKSLNDAFPPLFGDDWEEAGAYYIAQYRSYHLAHLETLPDVLATLDYVRDAAPFVGLVSNKRSETLHKEVAHLGWGNYFDVLVGAGDAARDKPYADPAELALSGSDIAMGRHIWFIGDTTTDLDCAQQGGMTPILFGDVVSDGQIYRGFPVAKHVKDHGELLALLRNHC